MLLNKIQERDDFELIRDIQAERRNTQEAREKLKQAEEELLKLKKYGGSV